jgi:hypothetical protein
MSLQIQTFRRRTISIACITLLALGHSLALTSIAKLCKPDDICEVKNAEDLIRIPASHWAIASRLAKASTTSGGFYLVDLEQRTAHVLIPDVSSAPAPAYAACPGALVGSQLVTHGLDLRRRADSSMELFAVNHGEHESIEVFDVSITKGIPKLTWKGCVVIPPDVSANAVAALPDGFVVTSFGTSDSQGSADLAAGRPAGFVARWKLRDGWTRVPQSGFGGDNGVSASKDGNTLYVNDWSDGTLRVLSLDNMRAPQTIKLGDFHPDNLHWLADGRLLIAGQVGKPQDIIACTEEVTCTVGSMVAIFDPHLAKVQLRGYVPPTSTFAAASTALLYGTHYWASSFRGDRITRLRIYPFTRTTHLTGGIPSRSRFFLRVGGEGLCRDCGSAMF